MAASRWCKPRDAYGVNQERLTALLLDFRVYDYGDRAVIDQGALHVGTENTFLDRAAGDFCQSGAVFFV